VDTAAAEGGAAVDLKFMMTGTGRLWFPVTGGRLPQGSGIGKYIRNLAYPGR